MLLIKMSNEIPEKYHTLYVIMYNQIQKEIWKNYVNMMTGSHQ